MSEIIAYLAGVIDSDGCIGVQLKRAKNGWRDTYSPRVQVKQVEPQAIDLLHDTFGGHRYLQGPSVVKGRPLYSWGVHSKAAGEVLRELRPYLRIKSAQADNALAVAAVNARGKSKHPVPDLVAGEEMVTVAEAAAITGYTIDSVYQAVRQGTVPALHHGRNVLIPVSFLPAWRTRSHSPQRPAGATAELHALYLRTKELNRVGV